MTSLSATTQAAAVGLFGGILLGLAARLGRFCTLGAIEDVLYQGSDLRLRMWALAIGVAMAGSFSLMAAGVLVPAETAYLSTGWNPAASIMGGLVFGYGMALAGMCGYGALARLGGGDIRAFVIAVVMGLSAHITLSGPLARARLWLFPVNSPEPSGGYAHVLTVVDGASAPILGLATGLIIMSAALASRPFLNSSKSVFWAVAVGIAVLSGWAGMSHLAYESFGAVSVVTHTYAEPIGESLIYLMTASGASLSFAVGSVFGVIAGAALGSLFSGQFRWEACDDPRELRRQIIGAMLMGVGAAVAGGCTVGQGISAMSVLAYGAPITLAGIMIGAAFGLRQLIVGFAPTH